MRIRFAKWAYDRLTEDADFEKKIIFSDEAHFDLVSSFIIFSFIQNKIQKVFLRRFPLSRFLAKTLRVNKLL